MTDKISKLFEYRVEYLFHPESPGVRVWVVRGFWGRLFKDSKFATLTEATNASLLAMARRQKR